MSAFRNVVDVTMMSNGTFEEQPAARNRWAAPGSPICSEIA